MSVSEGNRVAIVDGVRSPCAKAGTKLKDIPAYELGRAVLAELLAKTDLDPEVVDEVIFGNTGNPAEAANIARVIALNAGFSKKISAHSVHRNCASGLQSITEAFDHIQANQAEVVIAGGTESMSNMPLLLSKEMAEIVEKLTYGKHLTDKLESLSHFRPEFLKPVVGIIEGLTDPFSGLNMGQTAEVLAREFHISRVEQDTFALLSHKRAVAASESGVLAEEMIPIFLSPKYEEVIEKDIGPRENQTLEALAKLRPAFDRQNGTVTAGNSCGITDGAAALLIMKEQRAKDLGLEPLGFIRSYAYAGLDPERMGLGPVFSTPLAMDQAGVQFDDFDLIELNEAFAAQVLACEKAFRSEEFCQRELNRSALGELDREKLNVNGGAIALGHPVGATGTRITLTLLKEMNRRNANLGLATLCIGGGQGGAIIVERT